MAASSWPVTPEALVLAWPRSLATAPVVSASCLNAGSPAFTVLEPVPSPPASLREPARASVAPFFRALAPVRAEVSPAVIFAAPARA